LSFFHRGKYIKGYNRWRQKLVHLLLGV
jgi:hypothetical protein